MKVYVNAWEFNTGGGFNWYHTSDAADKAFKQEKKNVELFRDDNWTAFRFDFVSVSETLEDITQEIDSQLDNLCASAHMVSGPGLHAIATHNQ